jgi:tripartite-type tricarboxylate transporter receptor subunit TctC
MFKTLIAAMAMIAAVVAPATAQDKWPSRPVTIIVPFAAGGNTDVMARLFSERLSTKLGQQFIVENKTGAGGSVGLTAAARAAPDGYTIAVATTGGITTNPIMQKGKIAYDPDKDFTYLYGMASQPNLWVVHPSVPAKTMPEFIAWLKANPNTPYGTSGVGSTQHVCGEYLAQLIGTPLAAVAYRASNQTMQDLIAGQIKVSCDNYSSAIEQVRAGTIRAIAITSPKRYPLAPDMPTVAETLAGYGVEASFGWVGPANLPADITKRLAETLAEVGKDPVLRQRMAEFGVLQTEFGPADYAASVKAERATLAPVIEKAGMIAP